MMLKKQLLSSRLYEKARMDEIICRLISLPAKINAITVVDENGFFNVYVNSNLSLIEQQRAFKHECQHIKKNHFFINKSIHSCEQEAKN